MSHAAHYEEALSEDLSNKVGTRVIKFGVVREKLWIIKNNEVFILHLVT